MNDQSLENALLHLAGVSTEVMLRTIVAEDVTPEYVSWMNDEEVTRYTEIIHEKQRHEEVLDFVETKFKSKNEVLFGIFIKSLHIGNIKLGPVNWRHKTSEISFIIGNKAYWGKGYAASAIGIVASYAFDDLGLAKITAGVLTPNVGSARALEKSGFSIEGVRKQQYELGGKRVDSLIFGRLAS